MPRPAWSWKDYERRFGKATAPATEPAPDTGDANAPGPSNRDASTGGKPNREPDVPQGVPGMPAGHEGHQREGGDRTPRGGQGAAPAPRSTHLTITLNEHDRRLLEAFAADAGETPEAAAASLLRDLLADDAAAHEGGGKP